MTRQQFAGTGGYAEALANGRALLAAGRAQAALAQADEMLVQDAFDGAVLRLRAAALRRLGREAEAITGDTRAIEASSRNPRLVEAARLLQADATARAEDLLRDHLDRHPDDAAALRMLAEVAARSGATADAERLLREALDIAPRYKSALVRLARLLMQQARWTDALAQIDVMIADDADDMAALGSRAFVLARCAEYEQAAGAYAELTARQPDNPSLWISYGHVLKTLGRFDDSVAAYRHALSIDPALGEAWWSLANLKRHRFDASDLAAMESALAQPGPSDNSAVNLRFALGKALDDLGDFDAAFSHYEAGNRLRLAGGEYRPETITDQVDAMMRLFTPDFLAERKDCGADAPDPVFIVGLPRSGSTLTEQILASHSQIEGTSELPYVPIAVEQLILAQARAGGLQWPELIGALPPGDLHRLGEAYLASARVHRKTDRPLFTDKLPNNWLYAGLIALMLPRARIVDVRRNPLSCCVANLRQHFAKGQEFAYGQREIGLYYRDYLRLIRHFDAVMPGRIVRLIYDDLVRDSEAEIRRLLEALDLPFEEACLRPDRNMRPVRTPSAEQVRRPVHQDAVDEWRRYENHLALLIETLGDAAEDWRK